jgi:hypothetical protein
MEISRMSIVVNPSAGDVYFGVGGSALSTQPTINKGRSQGLGANQTLLSNVEFGYSDGIYGSQVVGGNDIGSLILGNTVNITSVAASGGKAVYTLNSHSLLVGDVINVTDTSSKVHGPQRVTAKTVNTFTTTKGYTSGAGTLTYKKATGHFANMEAGKWVMMLVSTELGGVANTTLQSAGSFERRPINKLEALRTFRVATAIRAGYWNVYTGEWSTQPTSANDISDWGTDQAANPSYSVPGELVYLDGSPNPILDDYEARTQ